MVTIVLGGQIGSEGKGKIAAYISFEYNMSIRSGGPNAGHTVNYKGNSFIMQLVPCAFINPKCLLAMSAGSLITPEIILQEIKKLNIKNNSLIIDPNAGIIEQRHINLEVSMYEKRLSTGKGVGYATAEKLLRKPYFKLAKDIPELKEYIGSVEEVANKYINQGKKIMIEGTQGFDLSLHHGSYPFVTSRDTTAGTLLGEVGISPRKVEDIIMVLRTYPIRASNGPLYNEITWEDVSKLAGADSIIQEFTSVTKRIRRVGMFDEELVHKAVRINCPTQLAVNFIDYIDYSDFRVKKYKDLSIKSKQFIERLERLYNVPVTLIGTGPDVEDIIDLRREKGAISVGRQQKLS